MKAGDRDRLIVFERAAEIDDGYNRRLDWENPQEVVRAWAKFSPGTSQEKREAAQEQATQTGTFIVDWSAALAAIMPTDRIRFDGSPWNITEAAAPLGYNRQLRFTAVRAV